MAVVNTRLGFVFLANPHTASRATETALMQLEHSILVEHHHAGLPAVKREYPDACACPNVFQTVRHPLDWLVSRFCCNGGERPGWKDWLRARPAKPIFGRFVEQANVTAKYETLLSDLELITGRDIILVHLIEHRSIGKRRDYMSYWDDEDIVWAKKCFASDFERFGYE